MGLKRYSLRACLLLIVLTIGISHTSAQFPVQGVKGLHELTEAELNAEGPIYTLQLGVYPSSDAAEVGRSQLPEEIRQQVSILDDQSAENRALVLGQYQTAADAELARQHLLATGAFELAEIRPITAAVPITSSQPMRGRAQIFHLTPAMMQNPAMQSLDGDTRHGALEEMRRSNDPGFRDELRATLDTTSDNDPLSGYLLTRLGIIDLLDGHREEALFAFATVADGRVAADFVSRVKAMRRVAFIAGFQNERLRAYQAYRELADLIDRDEALARATGDDITAVEWELAHCAVEEVDMLMELARFEGIGSQEDVRAAARRAYRVLPDTPSFRQRRATLELMYLETYHHDGMVGDALRLAQDFVDRYTAPGTEPLWREVAMAMYILGQSYLVAGDDEQAEYWFSRMISDTPETAEYFGGYHPHADGLAGTAVIMSHRGFHTEVLDIYRLLLRDYPNVHCVQTIRVGYPTLAAEVEEARQ
jgi:tetratricopeptide (TPR) repeat protein